LVCVVASFNLRCLVCRKAVRFCGALRGKAGERYKTFAFILENYPTLTRVSGSLKHSPGCRKKLRFLFAQVGALGHFDLCSTVPSLPIFGSKTRVKVGYFSNIAQLFLLELMCLHFVARP